MKIFWTTHVVGIWIKNSHEFWLVVINSQRMFSLSLSTKVESGTFSSILFFMAKFFLIYIYIEGRALSGVLVCVSVYICIYVHVCVYLCICVYACAYVYIYVSVCVSIHLCIYVYVCVYMCTCICLYVQMYISVCVCMCVYLYVCVFYRTPHLKEAQALSTCLFSLCGIRVEDKDFLVL